MLVRAKISITITSLNKTIEEGKTDTLPKDIALDLASQGFIEILAEEEEGEEDGTDN